MRFYDSKNTKILEAGYMDGKYAEHKIELKDGERIVGVKSGRR